jgi:hypothetical protein
LDGGLAFPFSYSRCHVSESRRTKNHRQQKLSAAATSDGYRPFILSWSVKGRNNLAEIRRKMPGHKSHGRLELEISPAIMRYPIADRKSHRADQKSCISAASRGKRSSAKAERD